MLMAGHFSAGTGSCSTEISAPSTDSTTALTSCNTTPPHDYTLFIDSEPKSILVLPPLDETLEEGASTHCLATVTRPLAERGYYVFPVAIVDLMMIEVQCGDYLGEDDIVRFDDQYGRVAKT